MTFFRFLRVFAPLALLGCGSVPLPFEGTWTGTLTRDFECASGGGSVADVPVTWTITRDGEALSVDTGDSSCPSWAGAVDPADSTFARLEVAHCETTGPVYTDGGGIVLDGGVQNVVTNTRTWTDGHLRLRSDGREVLVDAWEHDEGAAAGVPYVCDGLSFGALALEGG